MTELTQGLFSNIWGIIIAIFFFGGSIFIHELGHFLAAKRRGLKIERFSIGFGPKLFSWNRDGIEYCISLLPLGGYVALPQLAEMGLIEGTDKDASQKLPPISWIDKIIVAIMGPVFNLFLAFGIATLLWIVGVPSTADLESTVIGDVPEQIFPDGQTAVPNDAFVVGLRKGDTILKVDGVEVHNMMGINQLVAAGSGRNDEGRPQTQLTVERDGKLIDFSVSPVLIEVNPGSGEKARTLGIRYASPVYVESVFNPSPAWAAGLRPGDIIRSVDNKPLFVPEQIIQYVKGSAGKELSFQCERDGQAVELLVTPVKVQTTKPTLTITGKTPEDSWVEIVTLFDSKPSSIDETSRGQLIIIDASKEAKLLPGTSFGAEITSVNNQPVYSLAALQAALSTTGPILIEYRNKHSEQRETLQLNADIESTLNEGQSRLMAGFGFGSMPVNVHLNPVDQFSRNIQLTLSVIGGLLHPKSDVEIKNLSGVVTIGRAIVKLSKISIRKVLWFITFLNINLAILNLLPLPVLDGGHITFAILQKIRGKPLAPKIAAAFQGTFMILLMSLMLYIIFYDFLRWSGDSQVESEHELRQFQAKAIRIDNPFPAAEKTDE